jgi:hypothetical protein
MKIINTILEFISTIFSFFKSKSVEKKEEKRQEQTEKVETFHKEIVKNIEKGKIDAINEKLKF